MSSELRDQRTGQLNVENPSTNTQFTNGTQTKSGIVKSLGSKFSRSGQRRSGSVVNQPGFDSQAGPELQQRTILEGL